MEPEPKTSAELFNEISRLNKWGLSYCPPGETMSVDAPKCPSCGVVYRDHLGLIGTCKKLQAIFALVEAHRTEQHYRKSHADLRLWEAVLGLKDSTRI